MTLSLLAFSSENAKADRDYSPSMARSGLKRMKKKAPTVSRWSQKKNSTRQNQVVRGTQPTLAYLDDESERVVCPMRFGITWLNSKKLLNEKQTGSIFESSILSFSSNMS